MAVAYGIESFEKRNEQEAQKIDENGGIRRKRSQVPIWEKGLLTLEEASEYTGLGMQKLREISNDDNCAFVLWNGTKRMFKRKKLEAFLDTTYSL